MKKIFPILLLCIFRWSVTNAQLSALSDEFNSPCNLADWSNITEVEGWVNSNGLAAEHLEEFDVSLTHPGELYMMPYTTSWYNDIRGALLFKEVTGDFVFTTRIIVRNRNGDALQPSTIFSLAGMMIRQPRSITNGLADWNAGGENYVFLSIGRGNNENGGPFELEVKTTVNSNSTLSHPDIGVSEIFMRMVRVNGTIIVMRSFDNITWTVHARYDRSDLSETCQLGFVTYTDWPRINSLWGNAIQGVQNINSNILNETYIQNFGWEPDIIGRFEFARFDSLNLPPVYETANFMNVAENEVLTLFGYPTEAPYPSDAKIWNGSVSSDWSEAGNWLGGLPLPGDHIVVPNCSCTEMNALVLNAATPTLSGFYLEKGAHFTVPSGQTLNIDLQGADSAFINYGNFHNSGTVNITNASGKQIVNASDFYQYLGSSWNVQN